MKDTIVKQAITPNPSPVRVMAFGRVISRFIPIAFDKPWNNSPGDAMPIEDARKTSAASIVKYNEYRRKKVSCSQLGIPIGNSWYSRGALSACNDGASR